MTTLTQEDALRLARIRSDNLQWLATNSDARYWDTTFLLGIIDKQRE